MILRPTLVQRIEQAAVDFPVVALMGPRQCGKSTLASALSSAASAAFFDLEDPTDLARLSQPKLALAPLRGLVVLDEVQRMPDLFPLLRVLADRPDRPATFLILGTAAPDLRRQSAESLAGRVCYVDVGGFDASETGLDPASVARLWLRGGMPRSYLAKTESASLEWRKQFISAFLERDIPQLGIRVPAETLRRFWTMVASHHGQTWSASEIGGSLGVNHKTAQHYLDILTGALMVRQLTPWFDNMGKRLRRAPKVYLRDSGLLHSLLGVTNLDGLSGHPKLGASWEGFALEHAIRYAGIDSAGAFYWSIHGGAEIDLVAMTARGRIGFEFKYSDAPRMTKSLGSAIRELAFEHAYVVVPNRGDRPVRYAIDERATVVDLPSLHEALAGATRYNTGVRNATHPH